MARDRGIALGLAALALAYLLANRRYPLDTLSAPGPGAFPLAAGLALLAVAVWIFVTARPAARPAPRADAEAGAGDTDTATSSRAPRILIVVLACYAAALPVLGFIPASFALVVAAARLMGLPGLWRPLVLGAGLAVAMRLVFVSWLGVPLP
jgi:Tripartite tricarboxylate transporter TctB family